MVLLGPEGVSHIPRVAPVHLEMRVAYVEAPVARQLGLHDGQIVQAMVAVRQDQLKLILHDQVFNLPLSPYIKEGDMAQLRAQLLPSGQWALQLLHTGSFSGTDPNAGLVTPAPSRLNTLLFQPGGFASWLSLLQPGVLESMVPVGNTDLKNRLQAQRLNMASLQPQVLRRWIMGHLKSGEANLLDAVPAHDDTKALLRLLMNERQRAGLDEGSVKEVLNRALNEVEANQAQAAQDWRNGHLNLAFVIPFKDADPLEMQFERQGNKPGQPKNPLVVNMHTKSRVLGEVWLKTTITDNAQVDLTMWALKTDIAEQARFNASELTYELENAGLVLTRFQVFNAARPSAQDNRQPPPHGALVDTQA